MSLRKIFLAMLISLIVISTLHPLGIRIVKAAPNISSVRTGGSSESLGEANLELYVEKSTVNRLETQVLHAIFTYNGSPVPEAVVTFQINYPNGEKFVESNVTNEYGEALLTFKIPPDAPAPGIYWVHATAYKPSIPNATAAPQSFYVPLFIFESITLNDTVVVRVGEALKVMALIRNSWNLTETADRVDLYIYPSGYPHTYTVEMVLNEVTGYWEAVWTPSMLDPVGDWSLHLEAFDIYGYSEESSIYNFTVANYEPTIMAVYVNEVPASPNGTVSAYIGGNLTFGVDILDLDATPEELNVSIFRVSSEPTLMTTLEYNPESGLFEGWIIASENMTIMVQVWNSYNATDRWFLFIRVINNPPVIYWIRAEPSFLSAPATVSIEANASDYEDGVSIDVIATVIMPNGTSVIRSMVYNETLGYFITNFTVEDGYPLGTYLVRVMVTDSMDATAEDVMSFYYLVLAPSLSGLLINETTQREWTLTVGETLTFTVNVTDYDNTPEELLVTLIFEAPNGTTQNFTMTILHHYSDNMSRFTYTFTAERGYILPPDEAWTAYIRASDPDDNFDVMLAATVRIINTPPIVYAPTLWPPLVYRVRESLSVSVAVYDLEDESNLASVTLHLISPLGSRRTVQMTYDPFYGYWTCTWTPNATDDASRYDPWTLYVNATDTHGLSSVSPDQNFYVLNNIPTVVSAEVSGGGRIFPLKIFRVNETLRVVATVYDYEGMAISDPSDLRVFVTVSCSSPIAYEFTEELQYNDTVAEGFKFVWEDVLNWTTPVGNYTITITVRDYGILPPPAPPPPLPAPPPYESPTPFTYPFILRVMNARPEIAPITMNEALYLLLPLTNITLDIATAITDHETPPENMTVFCIVKWINGTADASPPFIVMANETMTYDATDGRFHLDFNVTTDMPIGAYIIIVTAFDRDAREFLSPEGVAFRANHFDYVQPALGVTDLEIETYGVGRGNQTLSVSAAVFYWNGSAWVPLNQTYAAERGWNVTLNLLPSWNVTIDPIYAMYYNETSKRWETGTIVVPEEMSIGEYFAIVTGGGVPSNETEVFTVTNAKPMVPAYQLPTNIMYRMDIINITAAIIDSDNPPDQLKAFFLGWSPEKRPFFDPPTINVSLTYTGYNYTAITFEFRGLAALPKDIPAGNYTCSVVVWDPSMAGYPNEYSVGVNMTLTVLNWLPSFWRGPVLGGVSYIRNAYVIRENSTLTIDGWVQDVEDGYGLRCNVTITGPKGFLFTKSMMSNFLNGRFSISLKMLPSYPSGNYTITIAVTDKDDGTTIWKGFVILNRPAVIVEPAIYPLSVYRVKDALIVSTKVVNDLAWETPESIRVYVNVRDSLGVWTNETFTAAFNGTHFVWEYYFPKEAAVGEYLAIIKVVDYYNEVTYSTTMLFKVLNNPPVIIWVKQNLPSIYRVVDTLIIDINSTDIETPLQNLKAWANITFPNGTVITYNVTLTDHLFTLEFVAEANFPTGNYTYYVYVMDTGSPEPGVITRLGPYEFEVLNNPPVIADLALTALEVYRSQRTTLTFKAWDVEAGVEVVAVLRLPTGVEKSLTLTRTDDLWSVDIPLSVTDPLGTYTITITVTDIDEAVATETITFEGLNNPPRVTVIEISARTLTVGETISGWVEASDVEGISEVKICFEMEGAWRNFTTTYQEGRYTFNINTKGWSQGTYNVYAVAIDGDGATHTLSGGVVTLTAPPAPPIPITWIAIAGVAAVVIIAAAIYAMRARKPEIIIEE